MANRKGAQDFILSLLDAMDPSGYNGNLYRELFKKMSDKDFHQYIQDVKSGKKFTIMRAPNYGKVKLSFERNRAIAKKMLGFDYFERLWIGAHDGIPTQLTPVPALVLPTRQRRQAQLVMKGVSVPKNMRTVNVLTGQPTGESQSAKISLPELQLCASAGMVKSMEELMKWRGGDIRGGAALQGMLVRHGQASLSSLRPFASGVESTNYVASLLTGAMIATNL